MFPSRIEPWIIGKLKTGFSLASTMHSVLAEEWNGLFVELIILIPSIPRASIFYLCILQNIARMNNSTAAYNVSWSNTV